jgi:2-keto-4-pentenoate hydratase/2-oxohepta-3-ene-1,7-dioic acid hydratase in catechol pathway
VLSPVTAPCRVICQGANYRQHMIESGLDPDAKTFNMFFEKSDASLAPPAGEVVRPTHVRLLDYEIELGLVIGAAVTAARAVTPDDLPDLIFGVVIANDISARDVQLPQTQFFKGKSYRGFCPVGPYLTVPERNEFALLNDLLLTLAVNGAVRQKDSTANLVFKPVETLAELTTFSDLSPRRSDPDRHAGGMRAARAAAAAAPSDAVAARARAVEGVRERAAEAPVLSQARRSHDAHDQEPRWADRSGRAADDRTG